MKILYFTKTKQKQKQKDKFTKIEETKVFCGEILLNDWKKHWKKKGEMHAKTDQKHRT